LTDQHRQLSKRRLSLSEELPTTSIPGAESAHQHDDQADQQNETDTAAAVNGAAVVESAATEQKE